MAKAKKPAVVDKAMQIAELRAQREAIAENINKEKAKVKELSAQIRDLEGPLPDRSRRKATGFTIAPAKG